MKYNIVILDDEEPARALMENYASRVDNLNVIATFDHAIAARNFINDQEVDILLSDIQMEDLTGIDLLKILKDPPVTIFTTAYSEHALEGYELDVVDYLLKPISFERFEKAIQKATELIDHRKSLVGSPVEEKDHFFVKTNRKIVKLKFEDILFIESFGEYVKIYTTTEIHLVLQTMTYMENQLASRDFFRIHRSHIVNLQHINQISGTEITVAAYKLTVSKRSKDSFMKAVKAKGLI
ncbi:MAG: LytTR family DNA-binding domain-containing protein [bacterium]|nr:LytTR family DNA-binding domain-containing protein [bacterium]